MELFVEMMRRGCSGALGHREDKHHGSLKLEFGGWDIGQSKEMGTVFQGNFYCIVYNKDTCYCCIHVLKYGKITTSHKR